MADTKADLRRLWLREKFKPGIGPTARITRGVEFNPDPFFSVIHKGTDTWHTIREFTDYAAALNLGASSPLGGPSVILNNDGTARNWHVFCGGFGALGSILTAGVEYKCSYWVRIKSGSYNRTVNYLGIVDGPGNNGPIPPYASSGITPTDQWQEISRVFTPATDSIASNLIYIDVNLNGVWELEIANVSVTRSVDTMKFCSDSKDYLWLGTPHRSMAEIINRDAESVSFLEAATGNLNNTRAQFVANSGLVPAEQYSFNDHEYAFYKRELGIV